MKKLLSCLLAFCMLFGLGIMNFKTTFQIKADEQEYVVMDEYPNNVIMDESTLNHTFSTVELTGTEFEGKHVEAIDGKLYVNGRIVASLQMWLLVGAGYKLVAYLTYSGVLTMIDSSHPEFPDGIFREIRNKWAVYQDMVATFSRNSNDFYGFKTSGGNECYKTSGSTFACKYGMRPDTDE